MLNFFSCNSAKCREGNVYSCFSIGETRTEEWPTPRSQEKKKKGEEDGGK